MSLARLMQMARAGVPAGDVWTDPDLANASYDSVSFSVAGQEGSPADVFFKPDGTKMYVTGWASDSVHEYNLTDAWDISSVTYVQSFSIALYEADVRAIFFKDDGTKMYVTGQDGDDVSQYTLSTAWDISTASNPPSTFSVISQDANATGIFFKPDGLKFFISGEDTDKVYEYSLSTAWDVTTASYVQNFSIAGQDTNPRGLTFNPDGTKFYIVGATGDDINEYTLSSAWDISTASYVQNFSVAAQDTFPTGFAFKSDGSKMYLIGNTNDTIYQYST